MKNLILPLLGGEKCELCLGHTEHLCSVSPVMMRSSSQDRYREVRASVSAHDVNPEPWEMARSDFGLHEIAQQGVLKAMCQA